MEVHISLYRPSQCTPRFNRWVNAYKVIAFYVDEARGIKIVSYPPERTEVSFIDILNHEYLHAILRHFSENEASEDLDSVSNYWMHKKHGCIGGL